MSSKEGLEELIKIEGELKTFKTLSDTTRFAIFLSTLYHHPKSIGTSYVSDVFGISPKKALSHLDELYAVGVIDKKSDKGEPSYSLSNKGQKLLESLGTTKDSISKFSEIFRKATMEEMKKG